MKKPIFTLFIFATCFLSINKISAQTEQGKVIIGTTSSLNFSFSTDDNIDLVNDYNSEQKISYFQIAPTAGYFIVDNLVIGGFVDFTFQKTKNQDNNFKTNTLKIGPIVRYYINLDSIKPYAQGYYSYCSVKDGAKKVTPSTNKNEYGFGVGTALFFNKYIALEIGLDYITSTLKESLSSSEQSVKSNNLQFNTGFSIHI